MAQPLKILGISGSLRKDSYNSAALQTARSQAGPGISIEIADISEIPLYDQDLRDREVPAAVDNLSEQIKAADAILFATPEYNYSVSGVLKNTIDWLSRQNPQPFAGKPAAIMSASKSTLGGARAHYDLRRIMIYLDVHFINKPEIMIPMAHEKFDDNGNLTDEDTAKRIHKLVAALADWTLQIRED